MKKPEPWKWIYVAGFLMGRKKKGYSKTHEDALDDVAEWLLNSVLEQIELENI